MKILKNIKLIINRTIKSSPIEYVSGEKSYGNLAEIHFEVNIRNTLKEYVLKKNIILNTNCNKAEIDFLIKYKNKLFIIEIKNWKGDIQEKIENNKEYFICIKKDKYTNEIYTKTMKSPFIQLKNQIKTLKAVTNSNPYINGIVFFHGAESINIKNDKNVWFNNIEELINYIIKGGKESSDIEIKKCIDNCKTSDYIVSKRKNSHCIIQDSSLNFNVDNILYTRKDISKILIKHHLLYDEVFLYLKNNEIKNIIIENGYISVNNGIDTIKKYSLSKIDRIILGI